MGGGSSTPKNANSNQPPDDNTPVKVEKLQKRFDKLLTEGKVPEVQIRFADGRQIVGLKDGNREEVVVSGQGRVIYEGEKSSPSYMKPHLKATLLEPPKDVEKLNKNPEAAENWKPEVYTTLKDDTSPLLHDRVLMAGIPQDSKTNPAGRTGHWTGGIKNNRAHGKGVWIPSGGAGGEVQEVFSGTMDAGMIKNGLYTYNDGSYYQGSFKKGVYHGKGRLVLKMGDGVRMTYTGNFSNGMYSTPMAVYCNLQIEKLQLLEGKEQKEWVPETTYEGPFQKGHMSCGLPTDKGTLTYPPGADQIRYTGSFKGGRPHGKGKLEFRNGDEYVGNFKEGLASGHGKMAYKDGREYDGKWKVGVKDGKGTETTENGNKVTGKFVMGVMQTA